MATVGRVPRGGRGKLSAGAALLTGCYDRPKLMAAFVLTVKCQLDPRTQTAITGRLSITPGYIKYRLMDGGVEGSIVELCILLLPIIWLIQYGPF